MQVNISFDMKTVEDQVVCEGVGSLFGSVESVDGDNTRVGNQTRSLGTNKYKRPSCPTKQVISAYLAKTTVPLDH